MKKYVGQLGIIFVITMALCTSALAGEAKNLVVLYTGDSWGHVDPCG